MNALIFLLIPVVIVAVGALVLWARARQPTSMHSGIDAFKKEMHALAPENERYRPRGGGSNQRRR